MSDFSWLAAYPFEDINSRLKNIEISSISKAVFFICTPFTPSAKYGTYAVSHRSSPEQVAGNLRLLRKMYFLFAR
jgi:hypothetical protein